MASEGLKIYKQKKSKRTVWIGIFIIVILTISIFSLSINTFGMSMEQAFNILIDHLMGVQPTNRMEEVMDKVVMDLTAPRTIAGILVGIILAIDGAIMQSLTRNSLAEPYTIGISAAAMFGISLSIALGIHIMPSFGNEIGRTFNAFIFALIPAFVIVFISSFKKMSGNMMILIGIGMMYLFTASTTFIKFNAAGDALHEIFEWSIGTLSRTTWSTILPLVIASIISFASFMLLANKINVLSAGDNMSKSLGVDPVRLRILCFIIVSLTTAIAVSYTGTIGFVGLVGPHIARLFVGSDSKVLIPFSAIIGAIMIIGADCMVRLLPGGLPCGVMTAMIGSPVFIYILYKQRKRAAF